MLMKKEYPSESHRNKTRTSLYKASARNAGTFYYHVYIIKSRERRNNAEMQKAQCQGYPTTGASSSGEKACKVHHQRNNLE